MTSLSVLSSPVPVNVITAVPLLFASIVLTNVLYQVLFKRRNEPPVVFHWLPIIGSTVTYGIDPFRFFFKCQKKVHHLSPDSNNTAGTQVDSKFIVWGYLYFRFARQESHRLFGTQRQSIHSERET